MLDNLDVILLFLNCINFLAELLLVSRFFNLFLEAKCQNIRINITCQKKKDVLFVCLFTDLYCFRTFTASSMCWIFSLIFSVLTSPWVPNVYSNSLIFICNCSISSYPSLIFFSSSAIVFSKSETFSSLPSISCLTCSKSPLNISTQTNQMINCHFRKTITFL